MTEKSRFLVIIPAYNEEKNIGRVIDSIQKTTSGADIVVIDDGSSDNTAKIVQEKGIRVLSHSVNLGPGAAIQTGYKFAPMYPYYDFVVQLDADGQHDPQSINDLLDVLKSNSADMVIGSRFLKNGGYKATWIRRIGMRFFGALTSGGDRAKD